MAHLRVIAPVGNTAPSEEMSQRWRALGNTMSDLTDPRFISQTSRFIDERVTALATGLFIIWHNLATLKSIRFEWDYIWKRSFYLDKITFTDDELSLFETFKMKINFKAVLFLTKCIIAPLSIKNKLVVHFSLLHINSKKQYFLTNIL